MKLDIIKGAINSKKTLECIERIKKIKIEDENARIFYIVPEQFSYSAEKLFAKAFGGTGLNGIEVMTFQRLTQRYLNRAKRNYMQISGRMALIQKAVNDINKDENIYGGCADKPGFTDTVSNVITELKRMKITPENLSECANNAKSELLKGKLLSIAEIYNSFNELNNGRFYDAEDDLSEFAMIIKQKNIFKDTYIFVDEFSELYAQHYSIIEAILETAKGLTISVPFDEDREELYQIPMIIINKVRELARKKGISVNEYKIEEEDSFFQSSEIDFYYKSYDKIYQKGFKASIDETKDIKLFSARDPYTEVENLAKNIRYLVNEKGYRYKDITVTCAGLSDYSGIIEAVFKDYNIKYFSDVKLTLTDHPIILSIISLFDIINENWSYDSVFKYLKTGFIYKKEGESVVKFSADDIDLLDKFVLKYGIKGKKKWIDENVWNIGLSTISDAISSAEKNDEEKNEKLNEVRKQLVTPIKNFIEKTSVKSTVKNTACALFEFLEEINLYEGISKEISELIKNEMNNEAEQLSKVWNLLVNVLDQIVTTLGEARCSRDDFKKILYSALSVNEISIIPTALDKVTVTSPDKTNNNFFKANFIIGAIRGKLPEDAVEEGIFSDSDRAEIDSLLASLNKEFGGSSLHHKRIEEYKLFRVIFSATQLLYVSYPLNNFNQEAQMPSKIINDLEKIFKNIKKRNDMLEDKKDLGNYFTVNLAYDYLLKNRNNKNDPRVKEIYQYFKNNDNKKLEVIKKADLYKAEKAKIKEKNAELLYGEMINYSATRLKVYADCPFQYFIKYGLGAKPEEVWQIQKFDLGTIMHYIISEFCKKVEENTKNINELREKWRSLTKEESDKLIDQIVSGAEKNIVSSVGKDEDKIKYLLMRINKIIKTSADTIRKSLTNGEYTAVEYEKDFLIKLTTDENVGIRGTIDRIDIAQNEETAGIRIIDYKSGKKDFSVVSVCNMQDIQLVMYAVAAARLFKMGNIRHSKPELNSKITGIMYNKLKDNMVDGSNSQKEEIEQKLENEMKLNGVVVLDTVTDEKDIEHYDITEAVLMDKEIETTGKSSYLKFELKKDGEPKKNQDIISRADFLKLTEYVTKKIVKADREIKEGNIEIKPYDDSKSSGCEYCEMSEICLFDKNRDNVRRLCKNEAEAWEMIDEELKNN